EMREEVQSALLRFGKEALAVECLRPADTRSTFRRFEHEAPLYERSGPLRVSEGGDREGIRFREHVLPVCRAIEEATRGWPTCPPRCRPGLEPALSPGEGRYCRWCVRLASSASGRSSISSWAGTVWNETTTQSWSGTTAWCHTLGGTEIHRASRPAPPSLTR